MYAGNGWDEHSSADDVVHARRMKAYREEAVRTGRSMAALLQDPDFDPLPLSRLIQQSLDRQHAILEGKIANYLDSRANETDVAHCIVLESTDVPPAESLGS